MNKLNTSALALAISLAFSVGAVAQSMSKNDYQADKDRIGTEYKLAKECLRAGGKGGAKDGCLTEVKARFDKS